MNAWLAWLVEPSPLVVGPEERDTARLLSGLMAVIVLFGGLSAAVQWWLDPDFAGGTLIRVGWVLCAFAVAYGISRTSHHRVAAWLAVAVPYLMTVVQGLSQPQDVTWWAFMLVSPLFATMFLSTAASAAVALLTAVSASVVLYSSRGDLEAHRWVAPIAFLVVYVPLLITASLHRDRVERTRRAVEAAREAALAEAGRLEAIGRLAGGIAHDFNNLLTVVLANAELVGPAVARDPKVAQRVDEIAEAAQRAGALTRQLLAFARRQPVTPQPSDLARLVDELAPIVRRLVGSRIEVEIRRPRAAAVVVADPSQLEQVVLNLVANARDAMPRGGRLTLTVGVEAGRVWLSVTDTGTGMDPVTLAQVFEPFFTTKALGTGIGLSTTRHIVEEAGGTITARSELGSGSEFRVELPWSCEPAAASEPSPRSPASPLRVLLVDDDDQTRRALCELIESRGCTVTSASSAEAAMALWDTTAVDALVTDVAMPGMSGHDLALRLRQRHQALPVLFLSGHHDVQGLAAMPGTAVMEKPPRVDALLDKLRELTGGS